MLKLPVQVLESYLNDPVMAAEVLLGWKLDTFQRARLRHYWWVPMVIDSSGVSTGKTVVDWIYLALRCIFMPDHVAAVYFPNFQTGKDEFWQYYETTKEQSEFFCAQVATSGKNKDGCHKDPGAWIQRYKNGARTMMPAPGFMRDSETSASRRFNTLLVDDWLRAESMGEGIDRQLVDRTTRRSFNKRHPMWCNHLKFLGHAERITHKGYRRLVSFREAERDGSQRHARISFSYRDWSPKFAKNFLVEDVMNQAKRHMTRDQFRRQWLGLWCHDSAGYYPEVVLHRNMDSEVKPMLRGHDGAHYFLGQDTAKGNGVRSDFSAYVTLRAKELPDRTDRCYEVNGRFFDIQFPFARIYRKRTAPQLSGMIYDIHHRFGLSGMVMDPGGGGLWVYDQMQESEQLIGNERVGVVPLCTSDDPLQMEKQPLVTMFKHGEKGGFGSVFNKQYLAAPEGLLEAAHMRFRQGWEAQSFRWSTIMLERRADEVKDWEPILRDVQLTLDKALQQICHVRLMVESDGRTKKVSRRGFALFESPSKKMRPTRRSTLFARS